MNIWSRVNVSKPTKRSSFIFTGDFSTRELLQEREPFNVNEPAHNTWSLIRHVNPQMKFIVMMRDPVERLYSDYVYFSTVGQSNRISPQHFHEEVLKQEAWWHACVEKHNERKCLYGSEIQGMAPLRIMHNTCWLETYDNTVCAAFRLGLYYYYIVDWLEVFPREQFLFLSTERYSDDTVNVINSDILLQFLKLEPFQGQAEKDIRDMPIQFPLKRDAKGKLKKSHNFNSDILPETREILEQLYRPSNLKLAQFLNNTDFLWYDKEI